MVEARNMTRPLGKTQCYELYEIVINKLQRTSSDRRSAELEAVKISLEERRDLDVYRMKKVRDGYGSEMAAHARASEGNTQKWKKKT